VGLLNLETALKGVSQRYDQEVDLAILPSATTKTHLDLHHKRCDTGLWHGSIRSMIAISDRHPPLCANLMVSLTGFVDVTPPGLEIRNLTEKYLYDG
jgi:hypothetical protein